MYFKNVGMFENLITFEKDTSTEGTYLGKKVIKNKEGTKYNVHSLTNPTGQIEEFFGGQVNAENPNGSGSLDYLLSQVNTGDYIRVTYKGLSEKSIETKHGIKPIHQWKVEIGSAK